MDLVPPAGIVTLTTDFGTADPYVGVMKGMVLRAHPHATVVDLCHEVPPQHVDFGAFVLAAAVDRFPPGTVHLGVVDPGVGTSRAVLAAFAHECYWVGPDNGLLSAVLPAHGAGEVRAVEPDRLQLRPGSATFWGRDVFAPLAGWLAGGRYGFRALGGRASNPVRRPGLCAGGPRVIHVDRYGNLVTNVPAAAAGGVRALRIAGRRAPLVGTYSDAEPGSLLAVVDSYDLLEVAVRDGSAAQALGAGPGSPVELEQEPR